MGLGLGYNEDLMTKLAIESSGNHTFIEQAENLVAVFQREFDDVMSVVAQQIIIQIKLAEGVRPVKVLNYPANIEGQIVTIQLGQLYASQKRYFVLELEIPAGQSGSSRPLRKSLPTTSMRFATPPTSWPVTLKQASPMLMMSLKVDR